MNNSTAGPRWRREYRCPCDGSDRLPGAPYGKADEALRVIEHVAGARPHTCPWQAYSDPTVARVLDLCRAAATGMGVHLASVWALNPPHYLWDGLQHYAHAVAKVREEHDRLAAQMR